MPLPTDADWPPLETVCQTEPAEVHSDLRLVVVYPTGEFSDPEARIYAFYPKTESHPETAFYMGGRLRSDGPLSLILHQPKRWGLPDAKSVISVIDLIAMIALLTERLGIGTKWLMDADAKFASALKRIGFCYKSSPNRQKASGKKWIGETTPKPSFWDPFCSEDNLAYLLGEVVVEGDVAVKMRLTPMPPKTALDRKVAPRRMLTMIIAIGEHYEVNTTIEVDAKNWPSLREPLASIPRGPRFMIYVTPTAVR